MDPGCFTHGFLMTIAIGFEDLPILEHTEETQSEEQVANWVPLSPWEPCYKGRQQEGILCSWELSTVLVTDIRAAVVAFDRQLQTVSQQLSFGRQTH